MDHCQNASDPEPMDGLIEVPEPKEPDGDVGVGKAGEGPTDGETTVQTLDAWAAQLRQRHLTDALTALEEHEDLDQDDRAAIAACSRALVDEILRCPRWRLRSTDGEGTAAALDLFGLDSD